MSIFGLSSHLNEKTRSVHMFCMREGHLFAFHMISSESHGQHLVIHLYAEHVSCNDLSFIFTIVQHHLTVNMDANRFAIFRQRLFQVYSLLEEGQVKQEFDRLAEEFPELNGEEASPADEAKALASGFQALCLQTPPSVEKKKIKKKTKEEVKKFLAASLENTDALTDYSDVDAVVSNTEQDCLEKLRLLNKALVDANKRLIYFSALQGEVLQQLKNITKCTINELGKKPISPNHIYIF